MRSILRYLTGFMLVSTTVFAADNTAKIGPFNQQERTAITSHYQALHREAEVYAQYHESGKSKKGDNKNSSAKSLPPGLKKKAAQGNLPPGWQKKLKKGAVLPPDILAVADPLPPALIAQLPAGPAGTITVHVDGQIIRVLEATRTIVDFFGLVH